MKWNTDLYDQQHGFVTKYGEDLVTLLNPREGERILDLGCGTGDLAATIQQSGAFVIGMDSSPEMINTASAKYPTIQFDVKSAEAFSYDEPFDAIFSNATLHWVADAKKAATCIYNNLKPGGRLVAEFGGKGNVANIVSALKVALQAQGYAANSEKTVWYFPSLSAYASLLEELGFRVSFAAHFDRPTRLKDEQGLQNWLRMFGAPYLDGLPDEVVNAITTEVENRLRATNFINGNWYADYVRLRVIAYK
jgi:trans-aconitate methyltransferase